jgi:hypothetical protein
MSSSPIKFPVPSQPAALPANSAPVQVPVASAVPIAAIKAITTLQQEQQKPELPKVDDAAILKKELGEACIRPLVNQVQTDAFVRTCSPVIAKIAKFDALRSFCNKSEAR